MDEKRNTTIGGLVGTFLGYHGFVHPTIISQAEAVFGNGARYPRIQKTTFIRLHGAVCGGSLYGMWIATNQLVYRILGDMRGVETSYFNSLGAACATFAAILVLYPGSFAHRKALAISGTCYCLPFLELSRAEYRANDPTSTMH